MFVYETNEGYEKIPFSMSDLGGYAYADGQKVPFKTQGNNILVPTEEGLVAVPIEEFDVVMVDGQVMLVAEENPSIWAIMRSAMVESTKPSNTWTRYPLPFHSTDCLNCFLKSVIYFQN